MYGTPEGYLRLLLGDLVAVRSTASMCLKFNRGVWRGEHRSVKAFGCKQSSPLEAWHIPRSKVCVALTSSLTLSTPLFHSFSPWSGEPYPRTHLQLDLNPHLIKTHDGLASQDKIYSQPECDRLRYPMAALLYTPSLYIPYAPLWLPIISEVPRSNYSHILRWYCNVSCANGKSVHW